MYKLHSCTQKRVHGGKRPIRVCKITFTGEAIYHRASVCVCVSHPLVFWLGKGYCVMSHCMIAYTHAHSYAFLEHSVWWNGYHPKVRLGGLKQRVLLHHHHTHPPSHNLRNRMGTKQVSNYFIFLRFRSLFLDLSFISSLFVDVSFRWKRLIEAGLTLLYVTLRTQPAASAKPSISLSPHLSGNGNRASFHFISMRKMEYLAQQNT